jgi:four helix bundle protein
LVAQFEAFQVALQLVTALAPISERLRGASCTALAAQLDEAGDSVALNTAEGNGRHGKRDRARFFDIARASAKEVSAALAIAVAKRALAPAEVAEVEALADRCRAMLYRLARPPQ